LSSFHAYGVPVGEAFRRHDAAGPAESFAFVATARQERILALLMTGFWSE
jgi:hypothetical protein